MRHGHKLWAAEEQRQAAAGIALHTAWVAVVGLIAGDDGPALAYRGRVELISDSLPKQAYHAAAEGSLSLPEAEDLIRRWLEEATANACEGLPQVAARSSLPAGS